MTNPFGDEEHSDNPFGDAVHSANPFGDDAQAPETKLLSAEGGKAVVSNILPSVKQGILGLKLFKQENPDQVMSRPIAGVVNPLHAAATPEDIAQTQSELQANKKELQANTPANPSYPLQIATGAVQSIAQNVPALAASVATKNPTPMIASAMSQTKGQSYAEDRTQNPFGDSPVSQDNAVKNAGVKAGIEGALESVPAVGLLKDLTKTTVDAAGKEVKQSLAKTTGKFLLREEATEIPTSILQDVSHRVFAEPNKPLDQFAQETLSHAIDTAVTTPFAAGGTVAIAQAQQMAQDKAAAIYNRKATNEAQTLAGAKADLLADLDKRAQEAAAGIPLEDSVASKMAAGNVHADVPTTPLTPEEEELAKVQLNNLKSGANAVPQNPIAMADTADFDSILSDPVYQQPVESAQKKENMIQADMDRGMSREVAERRAMNEFPNALPPTQRPIAWSTNPAHVGLNLTQAQIAPDDVVVLGGNDQQFSPAYTQALGQTLSSWARTIMPEGSRIVINLSGLNGEAVGGYQQSSSGIHILTPRELVRTERGESNTPEGVTLGTEPVTGYNTFTQQQTFGALTHEFGHALIMASFGKAMPPAFRNVVGSLDTGRVYSEPELSQMPAPEAAVIREYQTMKQRVLDGSMSAEELVENWLGTWKLGKDLMKQQGKSLYSFANNVLLREAKLTGDSRLSSTPLNQIPAITLVHAMGRNNNVSPEQSNAAAENYYLQFNEYMAEQFSRYAHANRIDQGTPLGIYFKRALDSLRNFFKALKTTKGVSGDTVIKPGTSFQSWVDGMGMAKALRMADKAKPKTSRRPALRKAKKVPDIEDLPQEISKAEKVKEEAAGEGVAVDELEALAEDKIAKDLMKDRIRKALPDPQDRNRAELMRLVARGQLLDAEDQLIDIINEQVKKDMKEAGGTWDQGVIETLTDELPRSPIILNTWARKAILRYLNKWAGTKNDPIKSHQIPVRGGYATIEEVWDNLVTEDINSVDWNKLLPDEPDNAFVRNIKVGERVYNLDPAKRSWLNGIRQFAGHVYDYVREFVPEAKLQQYDFVRAVQETIKQDERQAAKMATTEAQLGGTVVFRQYPDGMQWVEVKSESALKNEGDTMGHCVGGYCEMVHNGHAKIYSLRDAAGRPHVTIEVTPAVGTPPDPNAGEFDQVPYYQKPRINQIKGKQNLAPIDAYTPHVQDFVLSGDWSSVGDLDNAKLGAPEDFFTGDYSKYEDWARYVRDNLGDARYFQGKVLRDLFRDYVSSVLPNKPLLDKDVGDPQEIDSALKRIGITNTSLWTRAINFFKDMQQSLLQMQQISHTTDDAGAVSFVMYQNKLMAMKNNMLKNGTDIAKRWETLSRAESQLMEKILMDEFYSGGHATELTQDPVSGKWSHSAGIGFVDYTKQRGLDITTPEGEALGKLILDVKNSMLEHIQMIEDMAIQQVKDRYRQAPLILQKRANEVRALAEKWRRVPFVPQSHYGDYVVKVFEKDENGKRQLVHQAHFESAAEQDAAVAKLLKTTDKDNVRWFKMAERTGVQLTLPKDFLQTLEDTGEFTSDQLQSIGEAMTPLRDEKAFSKFARDASKVNGASNDILRNYANWIEDNANFVSKLTYGRMMTKARAWTRSDMTDMKNAGDINGARDKQRLLDTMTKTQQFIMHPMEEYFRTRSAVSLSFLMYAPKTALMNATGLFQTWAAVTADYGEYTGNKIMAKAMKDLVSGSLTSDEQWMKNQALEDGIIDQGFGYFMSGLANAGNLARRVRPTMLGKSARMFVDLGMYPFKAVETGNRNLTMLSIYRAERTRYMGQGLSIDKAKEAAYTSAASKTRLLQNDYASGNRPEILRGKKSLFMIFLSYPQYMLWIMSGGYERGTRQEQHNRGETPRSVMRGMTARMWLIFLALAGTEGVPFGETILELLQRMWTLVGKGENVRVEGQRFLKETAGIESMYWRNVIQRGFLHDVLGADLSGSYSLGKPLPGLGLINPQANNWKEFVGEAFADLSGPFGGVVKGTAGLGLADNVGVKELGSNLPGAAGSIARAINASTNGVKSSRGERILRDEAGNLREPSVSEIAAIGAGFRLSDVARFQQLEALKRQQADYWNGRRLGLKKSYLRAVEDRDPKVREDVLKAVDEYNSEAPDRGLRLTGKELREFTRNTAKGVKRLEQDRDPQRIRGLNKDISSVMQE